MQNARRLADQWRGFYTSCTQGDGKKVYNTDEQIATHCLAESGAITTTVGKRNLAKRDDILEPRHHNEGKRSSANQDSQFGDLQPQSSERAKYTLDSSSATDTQDVPAPVPQPISQPLRRFRRKGPVAGAYSIGS